MIRQIEGQISLFDVYDIMPDTETKVQEEKKLLVMDSNNLKEDHNNEMNLNNENNDFHVVDGSTNESAESKTKSKDLLTQKIREAFDKANNGTMKDKEDYILLIINNLDGLFYDFIKRNNLSYHYNMTNEDYADLKYEMITNIISDIPKYNPYKSKPSTFFSKSIYDAIRTFKNDKCQISQHYRHEKQILDKLVQDAGYEDIHDTRLNAAKLAILANYNPNTAKNIIENTKFKEHSFEEIAETNEGECELTKTNKNDYTLSPEQAYLNNEKISKQRAIINEFLSILTPFERYVFLLRYNNENTDAKGNIKPISCQKIAEKIKENEEILKHFNLKKSPSKQTISRTLERINAKFLNKQQTSITRKLRKNHLSYEQADMDDIVNAF